LRESPICPLVKKICLRPWEFLCGEVAPLSLVVAEEKLKQRSDVEGSRFKGDASGGEIFGFQATLPFPSATSPDQMSCGGRDDDDDEGRQTRDRQLEWRYGEVRATQNCGLKRKPFVIGVGTWEQMRGGAFSRATLISRSSDHATFTLESLQTN